MTGFRKVRKLKLLIFFLQTTKCRFWFGGKTMGGYCIGIAAEFVRQLLKSSLKQYRSSLAERNGPGGI